MGIIADKCYDEKGLVWPENIAPYDYYLISMGEDEALQSHLQETIKKLTSAGKSVIVDDRSTSFGTKANDADLLGIPHRLILSPKSLEKGGLEYKARTASESRIVSDVAELF